MIELPVSVLTADRRWPRWFPPGTPGPLVLAEHVRATGTGRCWADGALLPQVVAVGSAGHVLLSGDPRAVTPESLAPLAHSWVTAPSRFLPLLGAAFERLVPWERMVWAHTDPVGAVTVPAGVTVRRLHAADGPALHDLDTDVGWVTRTWGGPLAAASSGHFWGAVRPDGLLVSLACTYFLGSRREEIGVITVPEARRQGLALACVAGLCADIAARGRTPGWTCSRDNLASRRPAWRSGFRLVHEHVHHMTGAPSAAGLRAGIGNPYPVR